MSKPPPTDETVCRNRKAAFRFEILEQVDCGIVLRGTEVKSLRDKNASIEEAYARIEDDELWLIGSHIAAYSFAHAQNHDPLRRRKLLIHAREIRKLRPQVEQKGLTLVPLRIYFKNGKAKCEIALARGKKQYDRRQAERDREARREADEAMYRSRRR